MMPDKQETPEGVTLEGLLDPDATKRPMSVDKGTGQQYLYRFFDAAGRLLYVGITGNPHARFLGHRSERSWWSDVRRITMDIYPDRRSVEMAERAAIRDESPAYNVTGVPPEVIRVRPVKLPRGVRLMPSGRFEARFTYRGRAYSAAWDTPHMAEAWMRRTRRSLAEFGVAEIAAARKERVAE